MLKLKNISDAIKPNIEFDFYIPIKIRFEPWNIRTEPYHCWGIKNSTGKALLEIAIGERTGKLKYITLVSSPKIQISIPAEIRIAKNEKIGLPSFETQEWTEYDYYSNAIKDFMVYLNKNRMLIVLDPGQIELKIINDRLGLGFDKDNSLCTIEVHNISNDEKNLLEESLHSTGAL